MRVVCFSFSDKGRILGDRLENLSSPSYSFIHRNNREVEGGMKGFISENWKKYDGFIFISATGIAVRYIAPLVGDKTSDPAVLVIDDLGRYVISLLSGHLGGANELANYLGEKISALPIVTTATDGRKIESVDMFAKRNNYHMEDMEAVKDLTSLMVNNKKLGFFSDYSPVIDYPRLVVLDSLEDLEEDLEGLIVVSSNILDLPAGLRTSQLIPQDINIGIGCRRGVEKERILAAIEDSLEEVGVHREALSQMGTVEVKKDEEGIIQAAQDLGMDLNIFSLEEISRYDHLFSQSDFVKKTIGVYAVSEPSAYILGKELLMEKSRHNGITISISRGGNYE